MRQPIKDLSSLPIWKTKKKDTPESMDFHKDDVIYQELDGGVWTIVKRKGKYYRKLLRAL